MGISYLHDAHTNKISNMIMLQSPCRFSGNLQWFLMGMMVIVEHLWRFLDIHQENCHGRMVQCGAPTIAKLVYNSNNYGLWMFMALITIVMGVYKPTYNWGAPHCRLRNKPSNSWEHPTGFAWFRGPAGSVAGPLPSCLRWAQSSTKMLYPLVIWQQDNYHFS